MRNATSDDKFYEFWDFAREAWDSEQPAACGAQQLTAEQVATYDFRGRSPRSEVECFDSYCIYNNLWTTNGMWYVLVDGP